MGKLRFIHAADIHLGRPFSGLQKSNPELAEVFLTAGYQAWERIVTVAIDRKVDFVTLGGDTFDASYPTIRARVAFRDGVHRLQAAGIPIFMALGNHDPLVSFPVTLRALEGLHIFDQKTQARIVACTEFTNGVVVFGASFAKPEVNDNLVRDFRRDPGIEVAIGLIHANLAGIGGHKNYAPCTLDDLVVAGMDVWCLGHIHSGGIVRTDPLILYSGAAQGSHMNERGPKGCYLITISNQAEPDAEFVPLAPVIWGSIEIDVSGIHSLDDLLDAAEDGCVRFVQSNSGLDAAVVRINLQGSPVVGVSEMINGEENDVLTERLSNLHVPVFLETVRDLTSDSIDLESLMKEDGFLGEFLRVCRNSVSDHSMVDEMVRAIHTELCRKVAPRYIADEIDPRRLIDDPQALAGTMDQVTRRIAQMFFRSKTP